MDEQHKCPNYSIGIPPRCPDCGEPTPPERLAARLSEQRAAIMAGRPNDTTILAARPGRPEEWVILADRGPAIRDRFATAVIWPTDLTSWAWGHYYRDLHEALADFDSRDPAVKPKRLGDMTAEERKAVTDRAIAQINKELSSPAFAAAVAEVMTVDPVCASCGLEGEPLNGAGMCGSCVEVCSYLDARADADGLEVSTATMPAAQVALARRMTDRLRTTTTRNVTDWVFRVITAGTPLPRHGRAALGTVAMHAEVSLYSGNGYSGITAGGLGVLLDVSERTADRVLAELVEVGALDWSVRPDQQGRRLARVPQDAFDGMRA